MKLGGPVKDDRDPAELGQLLLDRAARDRKWWAEHRREAIIATNAHGINTTVTLFAVHDQVEADR